MTDFSQSWDSRQPSSKLQQVLRIEERFLELGRTVTEKIDAHVSDPWLKAQVLSPFQMVEANQSNDERCFSDFCRARLAEPEVLQNLLANPHGLVTFEMPKPESFYYNVLNDETPSAYSSFRGSCRIITSHRPLDSDAGVSMLYHELIHCGIDNTERAAILTPRNFQEYIDWEYPSVDNQRADLRSPDECWACGLQIELLNIQLDGLLAKGLDRRDYEKVPELLGAVKGDPVDGTLMMLAHLSTGYFLERFSENREPTNRFRKFYRDCMRVAGKTVQDYINYPPSGAVSDPSPYSKQLVMPAFVAFGAAHQ
ncbi:MAG: hypothetical protein KDD62_12540 [Bdellovibrionales bacterium]|nr:hypothetical protein [Bdellovibrionales bacterium]